MSHSQIPLPFEDRPSTEGIFFSQEQQPVWQYFENFPGSLQGAGIYVFGSLKSGKTHLAQVFIKNGAREILNIDDVFELSQQEVAVLDSDWSDLDLFQIVNTLLNSKKKFIFFSSQKADDYQLPDLKSRLKILDFKEILNPSEEFMTVLLLKGFADFQIRVDSSVIHFLIHRIERRYDMIDRVIKTLNEASLILKKPITIPLAKEILKL